MNDMNDEVICGVVGLGKDVLMNDKNDEVMSENKFELMLFKVRMF